ncbi:MAG: cupin domain-containing protein, partial [Clostridiales bacterium]|nr:cupin domain-containing protein [Clostridiales bacterium]
IFILEGEGKVLFDDKEFPVKPGEVLYCPEGHSHSLINNGTEDLVFYAVVPKQ